MNDKWEILHGDALKLLGGFAPGTFDAVITDPPYASGGRTQAEKNKSTAKKYSSMGDHAPPPFDGDAKDQRSWTRWAAEWLGDARKICKPGAPVCMFIDWRQLPAATDALQWAGWIWRGTAVWDKGNSRPQKGRFRQQAEYIVWGSNGDMPINRPVPCLPGVFKYGNPQHRIHLTEKPLAKPRSRFWYPQRCGSRRSTCRSCRLSRTTTIWIYTAWARENARCTPLFRTMTTPFTSW